MHFTSELFPVEPLLTTLPCKPSITASLAPYKRLVSLHQRQEQQDKFRFVHTAPLRPTSTS